MLHPEAYVVLEGETEASLPTYLHCPGRDFHRQDATPRGHTLIQCWTPKTLQNNAFLKIMKSTGPRDTHHESNVGQSTEAWPV